MGETAGAVLLLLSCLAVPWSVAGLIRPRLVLWWATPEKRTRGRALVFALLVALTLFFWGATLAWAIKWWVWIVDALCLFVLFIMASAFRTSKEELQEFLKTQEREKKLRLTYTAYSRTSDKEYEIRPFLVSCTCPDWEERRSGADGPFAVCKHLASHYLCHEDEIPRHLLPYKDLLLSFSIEGKGIPPQGEIYGYGRAEDNAYLFTGYADRWPWVNVYTDFTCTKKFGVNLETGRWSHGDEPPGAARILERIHREVKIASTG